MRSETARRSRWPRGKHVGIVGPGDLPDVSAVGRPVGVGEHAASRFSWTYTFKIPD
jgi:hypothetical protein